MVRTNPNRAHELREDLMKRSLVVATLALGLMAFGCDDSDGGGGTGGTGGRGGSGGSTGGRGGSGGSTGGSGGSTTGGSGGSTTGGSGGSTGGSGGSTGGSGGSTGGSAGDAGDAPAGDGGAVDKTPDSSGDSGGDSGGDTAAAFCANYTAGSGMLPNIEAMAFCMEYSTVCTFGGDMRYTNLGDCMAKYMAAMTSVKTCRAGHLCNAILGGTPAAKTTHCPHATGYGTVTACNPY
jgi:hypothetical protein